MTRRRPRPRTASSSRSASGRSPSGSRRFVDFHGNWVDWLGRVISSKDNPKLKLVRALQRKKERDETGLFACEGEDLCDAALEAGIEPVELLIAGENVEAELLAGVSTLPHPPRAIGVFRRADLPVGLRDTCLALWQLSRSRQRRHADSLRRRVRCGRLALSRAAPIRCRRRRCARARGRSSGFRSCRGPSGPAVRWRSPRPAPSRSPTPISRRP